MKQTKGKKKKKESSTESMQWIEGENRKKKFMAQRRTIKFWHLKTNILNSQNSLSLSLSLSLTHFLLMQSPENLLSVSLSTLLRSKINPDIHVYIAFVHKIKKKWKIIKTLNALEFWNSRYHTKHHSRTMLATKLEHLLATLLNPHPQTAPEHRFKPINNEWLKHLKMNENNTCKQINRGEKKKKESST